MYKVKATITWMSDTETIHFTDGDVIKREIVISQGNDYPASNLLVTLYGDKANNPTLKIGSEFLFEIRFFTREIKPKTESDNRRFYMEARAARIVPYSIQDPYYTVSGYDILN